MKFLIRYRWLEMIGVDRCREEIRGMCRRARVLGRGFGVGVSRGLSKTFHQRNSEYRVGRSTLAESAMIARMLVLDDKTLVRRHRAHVVFFGFRTRWRSHSSFPLVALPSKD